MELEEWVLHLLKIKALQEIWEFRVNVQISHSLGEMKLSMGTAIGDIEDIFGVMWMMPETVEITPCPQDSTDTGHTVPAMIANDTVLVMMSCFVPP